jgi:hypothetical protein
MRANDPPTPRPPGQFKDIIVAVHGIGEQSRFSTVRSVATRLAGSKTLLGKVTVHPIGTQPLGYFHSDVEALTSVRLLDDVDNLKGTDLATIGFAEVFWADIPQKVVEEGRTLEETKAWARTVIARANALWKKAKDSKKLQEMVEPDFGLAGEVLEEIIETVYVLENLTRLAEKAGLFKFDLKKLLDEYLGDVQIVAEFGYYRTDIVGRFHRAMESIYQQCVKDNPDVRLHIVAHSEGTVVSFLGLLYAMSGKRLVPAKLDLSDPSERARIEPVEGSRSAKKDECAKGPEFLVENGFPAWLKHVKGYMTIGSPIDKHLLLWEHMWKELEPEKANGLFEGKPIRWRNYYDYGDPVGFKLDTARLWLEQDPKCTAFQFCGCPKCQHDIGFARYVLPGAAHNEYWHDCDVFEHFIRDVVHPESPRPLPPKDKRLVSWLGPLIPYALSFLILIAGVFVLYKAVQSYTHPSADAFQRVVRYRELGIEPGPDQSIGDLGRSVFGIAALFAGATLLARFPRLAVGSCLPASWRQFAKKRLPVLAAVARHVTWFAAGFLAFAIGCLLYLVVPQEIRDEIGGTFYQLGFRGTWLSTVGVLVLAFFGGLSGYLVTTKRFGDPDRRQRWLGKGMRPLMLCGIACVAIIVLLQIIPRQPGPPNFTEEQVNAFRPEIIKAIQDARLTPDELNQLVVTQGTNWMDTLQKAQPVLVSHPPIWPVLLAGGAFLYLWWLATLLFDLAFTWQRYVRRSVANDRLLQWNPYGMPPRADDAAPDTDCRCPETATSNYPS